MLKTSLFAACLAFASLSAPAFAEQHAEVASEIGLSTGDQIPQIAEINSQGEDVTLSELMGENGVTLVFVRSAAWCPFCKEQMIKLNDIADELKAAGYPLVVLSYDEPAKQARFIGRNELSYSFISDEDSSVITAFGLMDNSYKPGSRAYGVPHPAIYKIGVDGLVQGKLMESNYSDRPANEAVLELVTGETSS